MRSTAKRREFSLRELADLVDDTVRINHNWYNDDKKDLVVLLYHRRGPIVCDTLEKAKFIPRFTTARGLQRKPQ